MISVFPDPRPDELICSVGGRYQDLFRFSSKHVAIRHFWGTANVKSVTDLPSHIGVLVSHLPSGHGYSAQHFIQNNTLLPIYAFSLRQDRVEAIQQEMEGTGQRNIHLMAGILSCGVHTPDYFMVCEKCIDEDQKQFGSCYFHRSHHAPGVKLCSKHNTPLLQTAFPTKARREFVSAERAIAESIMQPVRIDEQYHDDLLAISQDMHWLLNTPLDPLGLQGIRARYLTILIEQGFASPTGHVKTANLIQAFQSRFDEQFLKEFSCELEGHHKRNWIARIVQANQPQHPIRHLLFIRFLGYSVEEFYKHSTDYLPFGVGPWPCLNAVCDHYLKPAILTLFSGFTRNVSRRPMGTFRCPYCEFTYTRTGPDTNPADRLKRTKIISYGNVWNASLQQLWSDSSVYLQHIANELGVNQSTVYEQVKRLKLGARGVIPASEPLTVANVMDTDLASVISSFREQWLSILNEFPETGVAELLQLVPRVYSTLDRLDYDWLNEHKPGRPDGRQEVLVDWPARDALLVKQAPIIAERLKGTRPPSQRVTLNSIAVELGWGEGSIQRDIDHLPLSADVLPSLLETHEDFAYRRIQFLVDIFIEESVVPARAEFMKRAGLNSAVKTTRILNAVDEALEVIRLKLTSSSSGSPFAAVKPPP